MVLVSCPERGCQPKARVVGVAPPMRTNGRHGAEDLPDVELVQNSRFSRRVQPQHHNLCRQQAPSLLPGSMLQQPAAKRRCSTPAATAPEHKAGASWLDATGIPITTDSRTQP